MSHRRESRFRLLVPLLVVLASLLVVTAAGVLGWTAMAVWEDRGDEALQRTAQEREHQEVLAAVRKSTEATEAFSVALSLCARDKNQDYSELLECAQVIVGSRNTSE